MTPEGAESNVGLSHAEFVLAFSQIHAALGIPLPDSLT